MITKTVNVLGTDYIMKIGKRKELSDIADDHCGNTYNYGKKLINIVTDQFSDDGEDEANVALIRETIMHELAHAYLYESGLVRYGDDEVLAEWFGVNCRKLMNTALEVEDELGIV